MYVELHEVGQSLTYPLLLFNMSSKAKIVVESTSAMPVSTMRRIIFAFLPTIFPREY